MDARKEPLFSFRLVRMVLAAANVPARDAEAFMASVRMPAAALTEASCTVPLSRAIAFMDAAALWAKDPLLGLHLAARVPEGTYEAAELIARTAGTLGAGLRALTEHASLVNPIVQFACHETAKNTEVHHAVAGQRHGLGAQMNEYTLAYVIRGFGRVVGGDLPLEDVWFAHSRKHDVRAIEDHFGCCVRFDAPTSGFSVRKETAAQPLRTSDRVVFDYLTRQAGSHLAAPDEPFSLSVARAIEGEVGFAEASLASVAAHLGLTARTVQRRLADDGTQFRDVLDQTRQRHAEALKKRGLDDARIAELIGFKDVTTYRRASRRW